MSSGFFFTITADTRYEAPGSSDPTYQTSSTYDPFGDSLPSGGVPSRGQAEGELGRKFAQYLRFERNAERAWDDWLATTRIARPENDDAPAPMSTNGVDFGWDVIRPESRLRMILFGG